MGEVDSPLDQYIAFGLVVLVALWHLRGRPGLRVLAIGASAIDLVMQVLVAALGLALVVDPSGLTTNLDLGVAPTWDALAFSIPIALLAFTGLELVAALLRETKTEPRQVAGWTVGALLVTVLVYVMIAVAALSAYPSSRRPTRPRATPRRSRRRGSRRRWPGSRRRSARSSAAAAPRCARSWGSRPWHCCS